MKRHQTRPRSSKCGAPSKLLSDCFSNVKTTNCCPFVRPKRSIDIHLVVLVKTTKTIHWYPLIHGCSTDAQPARKCIRIDGGQKADLMQRYRPNQTMKKMQVGAVSTKYPIGFPKSRERQEDLNILFFCTLPLTLICLQASYSSNCCSLICTSVAPPLHLKLF